MANTKSAQKAIKVQAKQTARNKPVRSSMRTAITKARHLTKGNDVEAAKTAVKEASISLDKAAKKGLIHPNRPPQVAAGEKPERCAEGEGRPG